MNELSPTQAALAEALSLSAEILRNIELSELSLTNIALKASRLARLLNDYDFQKIFEYEVAGYPNEGTKVSAEVWRLGAIAGRRYFTVDEKSKERQDVMYSSSISQLEDMLRASEKSLELLREPGSSADTVRLADYRRIERNSMRQAISTASERLAARRNVVYQYVMRKHYELKYSGIADDIFSRIRQMVDERIGLTIPDAVQKFTAIYDNLQSENPENWSNAVHGCRRLLQSLADALFPPTEDRVVEASGKAKHIKLGKENYINRIIAFVQDNSESERFEQIVGSQLVPQQDENDG